MRPIAELLADVRREAERASFPVDEPVYRREDKDPLDPILFGGTLDAPLCVFARDLGKDEVAAGEPLIGAGGRQVRSALYRAATGTEAPANDLRLAAGLRLALLSNTVPYKPPGNKAYPGKVKERFRPFLAELLAGHWTGHRVVTLGTEAFEWFAPYGEPGAFDAFWAREDRYEAELPGVELVARTPEGELRKALTLCPLPHPSPLNQRWYALFPGLLERRLEAAGLRAPG